MTAIHGIYAAAQSEGVLFFSAGGGFRFKIVSTPFSSVIEILMAQG